MKQFYSYTLKDHQGNLTATIHGNSLERLTPPFSMSVSTSDWVHCSYSSSGVKLRKEMTTFATPDGLTTDYSGEFVYEDGVLAFVATPFGRAVPDSTLEGPGWRYCYHLKDYLGNVRAEFAAHDCGQPELLQQTDYYPFGYTLRRNDYGVRNKNRRLFGGKELQDETLAGVMLNLYDFEARTYDPTIGRFLGVDPLAEKYCGISPFAYCGNDPVNAVDLHGDSISIVRHTGFLGMGGTETLLYENGSLYNKDGSPYDKKASGFIKHSLNALSIIGGTDEGKRMLEELQSSDNMFKIVYGDECRFSYDKEKRNAAFANQIRTDVAYKNAFNANFDKDGGAGGTIYWNSNGIPLETIEGIRVYSHVDLAHELFHALDSNRGLLDDRFEECLRRSEWQALYRENTLRNQLGVPYRLSYYSKECQMNVKVLDDKNQPIRPNWYNL